MDIDHQLCIAAYEEAFKSLNLSEIKKLPNDHWCKLAIHANILSDAENKPEIIAKFKEKFAYGQIKTDYEYECGIELVNIDKRSLPLLFKNNNYNYAIIHKIIKDFYTLGKEYTLIKTVDTLKNVEIEYSFDKKSIYKTYTNTWAIKEKKLTVINFSNAFLTDKIKNDPKRTLKGKSLMIHYSFIVKDGLIHPIAKIELPVSPNVSMTIHIDIHPDSQEASELAIIEYYKEFDNILKERIDSTLRKVYNLSKKELEKLSLKDKKDYLTLIEMREF